MNKMTKLPGPKVTDLIKNDKPAAGISELAHQMRVNKVTQKLEQTKLSDLIEWPVQKPRASQVKDEENSTTAALSKATQVIRKESNPTAAEPEKRAREESAIGKEANLDPEEQEASSRKKRRVQPSPNYPPANVQTPFKEYSQAVIASQGAFHVVQVGEFRGFRAFVQGQRPSLTSPTYTPIKTTYNIPAIHMIPRISMSQKPASRSGTGPRYKPPSGTPSTVNKAFDKSEYRKLATVNKDLPPEFFAFCFRIGKRNMLPNNMVIDDDLADTFEAFYAQYVVPCDLRLPSKEVCQRAEADLLREECMEKWVRKGRGVGGGVTGGISALVYRGGRRMGTAGTRVEVGG